jgi:hypothetical protein
MMILVWMKISCFLPKHYYNILSSLSMLLVVAASVVVAVASVVAGTLQY